ncbi:hypothetical protein D3C78_1421580 [compost metagenome]
MDSGVGFSPPADTGAFATGVVAESAVCAAVALGVGHDGAEPGLCGLPGGLDLPLHPVEQTAGAGLYRLSKKAAYPHSGVQCVNTQSPGG